LLEALYSSGDALTATQRRGNGFLSWAMACRDARLVVEAKELPRENLQVANRRVPADQTGKAAVFAA
jgi:hypothetical protein